MKSIVFLLSALSTLGFMAPHGNAAPVFYSFDITIDTIAFDTGNLFGSNGVAPGSVFAGTFSYDDTATNFDGNSGNQDAWRFTGFSWQFGTGARDRIRASKFGVDVWSLEGFLPFQGTSLSTRLRAEGDFGFTDALLGPGTGKPIIGPPVLDDLEVRLTYGVVGFGGPVGRAEGTATLSLIPLPGGALLLLGGLGVLALFRRIAGKETQSCGASSLSP